MYNTLFAIKQLCELGETENANAMVSGLANFYRIGVSGGREIIPIKEEISHVESYLRIQQMRYEEDFCYSIQVDETVLSNTIIKLTLQPLVENAIYHGIKSKREFGRIVIYGRREGENVILEVRDNGAGMDKETLLGIHRMLTDTQVHTSQSYGLKNVNTRLKLQYGQEYGLSVESEIEKGTTVRVIIPVQGAQPPAVPQEEEE
ncbi:histidine kinase [Oscillospiraceae bacterium NSJ-64]|uniref:Histidine kinase n=1 Tax=Youxingia wuxianensis TaxID=2763678 RepID=A0A926EM52_9FIRM|nr:histidine kinase [Youxingia wuxianensis]